VCGTVMALRDDDGQRTRRTTYDSDATRLGACTSCTSTHCLRPPQTVPFELVSYDNYMEYRPHRHRSGIPAITHAAHIAIMRPGPIRARAANPLRTIAITPGDNMNGDTVVGTSVDGGAADALVTADDNATVGCDFGAATAAAAAAAAAADDDDDSSTVCCDAGAATATAAAAADDDASSEAHTNDTAGATGGCATATAADDHDDDDDDDAMSDNVAAATARVGVSTAALAAKCSSAVAAAIAAATATATAALDDPEIGTTGADAAAAAGAGLSSSAATALRCRGPLMWRGPL
jgi:hypothetical protein